MEITFFLLVLLLAPLHAVFVRIPDGAGPASASSSTLRRSQTFELAKNSNGKPRPKKPRKGKKSTQNG